MTFTPPAGSPVVFSARISRRISRQPLSTVPAGAWRLTTPGGADIRATDGSIPRTTGGGLDQLIADQQEPPHRPYATAYRQLDRRRLQRLRDHRRAKHARTFKQPDVLQPLRRRGACDCGHFLPIPARHHSLGCPTGAGDLLLRPASSPQTGPTQTRLALFPATTFTAHETDLEQPGIGVQLLVAALPVAFAEAHASR